MRDLARYPVTLQEMAEAVRRAADENDARLAALPPGSVPIGDIHGVALREAVQRLKRLEFAGWP